MLDTAASRTMLTSITRAQLNLAPSGGGLLTVYGINNVGTAVPVKPQELRLADEAIRGLVMGVLPTTWKPPTACWAWTRWSTTRWCWTATPCG